MSTEATKAVARRYFDDYLANKGVGGDDLFGENYQFYNPIVPDPLNLRAYHDFTVKFFGAFPDARFRVEDVIAEGDKVVTRYTLRATQAGPWISDIPVTGKPFTIQGFEIHRIADGRIVEQWSQFDLAGALRQLGVFPPAGE
jgi:steroid delta-isomerase-like uncharacterized protein